MIARLSLLAALAGVVVAIGIAARPIVACMGWSLGAAAAGEPAWICPPEWTN